MNMVLGCLKSPMKSLKLIPDNDLRLFVEVIFY